MTFLLSEAPRHLTSAFIHVYLILTFCPQTLMYGGGGSDSLCGVSIHMYVIKFGYIPIQVLTRPDPA